MAVTDHRSTNLTEQYAASPPSDVTSVDGHPGVEHRGGWDETVDVSKRIVGAAFSLTRRLSLDVAGQVAVVGKEVVDGVRHGRSAEEIATKVVSGCADGVRTVLGVDRDLEEVGKQLTRAAKPVGAVLPAPVKAVVEQVGEITPVRAALGVTGLTVQEVRWNLKAQGMELLQRSTALDDPEEHPALVRILTEISPDEARIIRFLATQGPQAVIDVVAHNPMTRKKREMVHNFSIVGREAGCIRPQLTAIYLDNLARLGIAAVRDYRLRSQRNYDLLTCQPEVTDVAKPRGQLVRLKIVHKGVELSEFGKVMYRNCLETPQHRICPVPDKL